MPVAYKARIKDEDGALVAETADWRSLAYRHRVNSPGNAVIVIDGHSPLAGLFELDGQLELWRTVPEWGIPWYKEWEGLFRTKVDSTGADGLRALAGYYAGYLDLAAREIVAYRANNAYSAKSGVGAQVLYDYANENIGPAANAAARYWDGRQPGLVMGAAPAAGSAWDGARAGRNLLDVLQEIATATGVDFDILGIGPDTYVFNIYAGQRGWDRTTAGLTSATGLNASGYAPVIFSLGFGNMEGPVYSLARSNEVNTVAVLGPGEGADRIVEVRATPGAVNASKRNRRAISRNASTETTVAELDAVGDAILQARQAVESLSFRAIQTPGSHYGPADYDPTKPGGSYWFGDRVTGRYYTHRVDERIIGVDVTVQANDQGPVETVDLVLGVVP